MALTKKPKERHKANGPKGSMFAVGQVKAGVDEVQNINGDRELRLGSNPMNPLDTLDD